MIFFEKEWYDTSSKDEILGYLTTGQALFETVFYERPVLWFWERHEERLKKSLSVFGGDLGDYDVKKIIEERLAAHREVSAAKVKIVVLISFLSNRHLIPLEHLILQIEPVPQDPPSRQNLTLYPMQSPFSEICGLMPHKTINYGHHFFYRGEAQRRGYDDVLYFDSEGNILETSLANIFAVKGEKLYTPAASHGILPGTMRSVLLEHWEVEEHPIHLDSLTDYDYFFLSGSVRGIRSVRQIGEVKFNINPAHFQSILTRWNQLKIRYRAGEIV
ncbi:MAG: aminotransferase class IV [Calditrichia bacterium]